MTASFPPVCDADAVRDLVTHHFAADLVDASARALDAGVDMEMAMTDPAFNHMLESSDSSSVSTDRLDTSDRRVLRAEASAVLLRNERELLQLPAEEL